MKGYVITKSLRDEEEPIIENGEYQYYIPEIRQFVTLGEVYNLSDIPMRYYENGLSFHDNFMSAWKKMERRGGLSEISEGWHYHVLEVEALGTVYDIYDDGEKITTAFKFIREISLSSMLSKSINENIKS